MNRTKAFNLPTLKTVLAAVLLYYGYGCRFRWLASRWIWRLHYSSSHFAATSSSHADIASSIAVFVTPLPPVCQTPPTANSRMTNTVHLAWRPAADLLVRKNRHCGAKLKCYHHERFGRAPGCSDANAGTGAGPERGRGLSEQCCHGYRQSSVTPPVDRVANSSTCLSSRRVGSSMELQLHSVCSRVPTQH